MSQPRFLLLTASTGNGHTSAANALRDEFLARGCDAEVVNVMDHVVKAFRRWFQGGYEMLVRRGPDVWGLLYRTSDRPYLTYQVQTFLDKACSYPIDQIIRNYRPDWIVNTHSVAQPRLPKLKRELGFGNSVVVTDLYPHRMWMRGHPDFELAARTTVLLDGSHEHEVAVYRRRLGPTR
jgi:processive 1,2-diacylglycerol beta-glucosyltransferase